MRRQAASRRRSRAGFTMIEVMVSLGIMMVGAMAIISLQQHTIRANVHARQLTTAMLIAQRWSERLKQDGHTWNEVGTPTTLAAANVLGDTQYLDAVIDNANTFVAPPGANGATVMVVNGNRVSNAFDFQGNDVPNDGSGAAVVYCAAMRTAWVYFGRAMRVDVRVFWKRAGIGSDDILTDFESCAGDQSDLEPDGGLFNQYHVVYLPTVIRMLPVVR